MVEADELEALGKLTVCVPSRSILLFISAMHCFTMKSLSAFVRSVSGTKRALERTFEASTEVAFSVYSKQVHLIALILSDSPVCGQSPVS